jgi:hypothetical protein
LLLLLLLLLVEMVDYYILDQELIIEYRFHSKQWKWKGKRENRKEEEERRRFNLLVGFLFVSSWILILFFPCLLADDHCDSVASFLGEKYIY